MKVLAVGAHPDDVEFGCGGTLARHIDEGDSVDIVVMTTSAVTDAHTGNVLRTVEQSILEAKEAANSLGVQPIIGPFHDTKVPFNGTSVAFLERIIKELGIDRIYTHWPGDSHQDHIATLNTVLAAGRLVPTIICYEQVPVPRVSPKTVSVNMYVNITDFWDEKIRACAKHTSQVKKFLERQGVDILDQLYHQARFRGGQSGCRYAEGFHILKMTY